MLNFDAESVVFKVCWRWPQGEHSTVRVRDKPFFPF